MYKITKEESEESSFGPDDVLQTDKIDDADVKNFIENEERLKKLKEDKK